MKTCNHCRRELPEEAFYKRPDANCRRGECIECRAKYMKNRLVSETPEQRAARLAKGRENWLRAEYGISVADYDRMVAEQDGKCASCSRSPDGTGVDAVLHVDHDHETGVVRALLCGPCNKALGILRDDPNEIWNLLLYARRHQRAHLRLVA